MAIIIDCIIGAVCIQGWCNHKTCEETEDCPIGEKDDEFPISHISYCKDDICQPIHCRLVERTLTLQDSTRYTFWLIFISLSRSDNQCPGSQTCKVYEKPR